MEFVWSQSLTPLESLLNFLALSQFSYVDVFPLFLARVFPIVFFSTPKKVVVKIFGTRTLRFSAGHGVRQVSPHAFHQVDGQLRKRGGGVKCEVVGDTDGVDGMKRTTAGVLFLYLLVDWSCLTCFLFFLSNFLAFLRQMESPYSMMPGGHL